MGGNFGRTSDYINLLVPGDSWPKMKEKLVGFRERGRERDRVRERERQRGTKKENFVFPCNANG